MEPKTVDIRKTWDKIHETSFMYIYIEAIIHPRQCNRSVDQQIDAIYFACCYY